MKHLVTKHPEVTGAHMEAADRVLLRTTTNLLRDRIALAIAYAEERGRQAGGAQLRDGLRHCPHACLAPCPHHRKLDEVCAKLGIGGKEHE